MTTHYASGRAFEYRVRDELRGDGYFVVRSAGSKGIVDIVAIRPGQILLVQCKNSGVLPPQEWNELYRLGLTIGAMPIMARKAILRGEGVHLFELLAEKDSSTRVQPMKRFYTDEITPL